MALTRARDLSNRYARLFLTLLFYVLFMHVNTSRQVSKYHDPTQRNNANLNPNRSSFCLCHEQSRTEPESNIHPLLKSSLFAFCGFHRLMQFLQLENNSSMLRRQFRWRWRYPGGQSWYRKRNCSTIIPSSGALTNLDWGPLYLTQDFSCRGGKSLVFSTFAAKHLRSVNWKICRLDLPHPLHGCLIRLLFQESVPVLYPKNSNTLLSEMPTFLTLPNELLLSIAKKLESERDLSSLCQTCHHLYITMGCKAGTPNDSLKSSTSRS